MTDNKIVIGRWETTAVLINCITTQVYLDFPRLIVLIGGTAAWMVIVYICVLALLWFLAITRLYSHFEGKDLLDVAEYAWGLFGRILIGTIIFIFILFIVSFILREFTEDMKIISLAITPISYVTAFFVAGMVFAAYMGIEVIVRFHAVAIPAIIAGFLIIVVGVAPYYDKTNLLPVFGNGINDIFVKGLPKLSAFCSLLGLLIIFPFIKTNKNFKRCGVTAILVASLILVAGELSYTLVFPYPTSEDDLLPVFQLARLISYGRFFQRIESIFVLIWAFSAFLFLSFGFYLVVHVFNKTFRLKYYRPMIFSFAVITFSISMLPQNLMATINLENNYAKAVGLFVGFLLPLIVLIAASIVKKRKKKEGVKR